jgi:hypothetical protein
MLAGSAAPNIVILHYVSIGIRHPREQIIPHDFMYNYASVTISTYPSAPKSYDPFAAQNRNDKMGRPDNFLLLFCYGTDTSTRVIIGIRIWLVSVERRVASDAPDNENDCGLVASVRDDRGSIIKRTHS